MINTKSIGTALIASLILTLAGCDHLTRDRFHLIDVRSSTSTDVKHTLGEPTLKQDGRWHYQRHDQHLNVIIDFDGAGVVTRKQWIDATDGEWYDSEPSGSDETRESTTVRTGDN